MRRCLWILEIHLPDDLNINICHFGLTLNLFIFDAESSAMEGKKKKTIESKKFSPDEHDEFVKELELGDIVCTYSRGKVYHAGIYCGSRKDPHSVLMKYLKPNLNICCQECGTNLVLMDCGHNAHFVADLSFSSDGRGGSSGLSSTSSSVSSKRKSQTKYSLSVLKNFMGEMGTFKLNFNDDKTNPLPVERILENALKIVTNPQSPYRKEYNMLSNNCEHFASCCRYGKPTSKQVERVKENLVTGAKIGAGIIVVVLGYVGVKYSLNKRAAKEGLENNEGKEKRAKME